MQIDDIIRGVVVRVIEELEKNGHRGPIPEGKIPVGISNRHVHLTKEHIEQLFGPGYELTKLKDLSQPGQYAANETVTLVGPVGIIQKVRILGPARPASQVELSITDGYMLGIELPVRESGDIKGTPGITLVGPRGIVHLKEGAICALRHIHANPDEAERLGLRDKQMVAVITEGVRSVIFNNVLVRVSEKFALDFHIDIDEANAAGLKMGDYVSIYKI